MTFEVIDIADLPLHPLSGRRELADAAISELGDDASHALVFSDIAADEVRSLRTSLSRAGTRNGIKVRTWYDEKKQKLYVEVVA